MTEIQKALEDNEQNVLEVTIKTGDTIFNILRDNHIAPKMTLVQKIIESNNLDESGNLRNEDIGKVITIPVSADYEKVKREEEVVAEVTTASADSTAERAELNQEVLQTTETTSVDTTEVIETTETIFDKWTSDEINTLYKDAEYPESKAEEFEFKALNEAGTEENYKLEFKFDGPATFVKVPQGWSKTKFIKILQQCKPNGRDLSYLELTTDARRLVSINATNEEFSRDLGGEWMPLPISAREEREISSTKFFEYCNQALDEILDPNSTNERDKAYANELREIAKKINRKDLLSFMFAIAKKETSNGIRPIGSYVVHRWEGEKHEKYFSYSLFHITVGSPGGEDTLGKKAAKKLQMSPGQMMHPKNAAKLFIGFYCEMFNGENDEKYLRAHSAETTTPEILQKYNEELAENFASFATFKTLEETALELSRKHHNNRVTKDTPYVQAIKKYLEEAREILK